MAGNTINFELRLNSNIKNETQDAKQLNKELDKAAGRKGTGVSARQTVEYGRARGSMEATGAGARDFANQAQGLGGLVRLYATYAANVFALSAAFQSLSAAMDTKNMISGLTQLSAASGQSLGAISKQFAAATQNSLSMREAMESTTRAVSSGLSGIQAVEIAEMATKASQALGVNLTDAVSRLTRGITKFEPELLDELGIFVRLDSAVEAYAQKVGKATSALTVAERQQAFYNAVIEQTRKKFGEIDIPINPYTKFLAVLKDISFTALNLINTVLTPLIKLLSENPVVLAAAIGLLAKNLLGSVIPVIKDYNKQLTNSTTLAQNNFKKQAAAAKAARDVQIKAINQQKQQKIEALETKEYTRLEALEKQQKLFETAFDKPRLQSGVRNILIKDIQDITEKELKYLDKLGTRTKIYGDIADSIRKVKTFDADILKITEQTNKQLEKRPNILTAAGQAQYKANVAAAKAGILQTIKTTGETVDVGGLGTALKNVGNTVRQQNLGAIGSVLAGIAGGATVAAKGVGLLFTAFSRLLLPLGLLYTAYEILSAIFVNNEKEVAAYEQKLEELTETTKTASNAAKKYKDNITIEGLVAQTTALESSNKALEQTVNTYEQAAQKIDVLSRIIDVSLGVFNRGQTKGFIKATRESIIGQLATITDPEIKAAAELSLQSILNISTLTPEAIGDALEKSADKSRQALVNLTRDSQQALAKAVQQQKQLIAPLKEIEESGKQLEKTFKDLQKSFDVQDKFSGYILALGKDVDILTAGFNNSNNQIAIFNKLLTDQARIGFLPAGAQQDLTEALNIYKNFAAEQKKLNDLKTREKDLLEELKSSRPESVIMIGASPEEQSTAQQTLAQYAQRSTEQIQEDLKNVRENIAKTLPQGFTAAVSKFREGLLKANQEVIDRITSGYTRAARQVEIDFKKQVLGSLPQSEKVAQELTKLELDSIQVRREEITAIRSLTQAIQGEKLAGEIARLEKTAQTQTGDTKLQTQAQISSLKLQQQALINPEAALAAARSSNIPLNAQTRETILAGLGQQRELAGLASQEQFVKIRGAGQAQAAKAAENVQRQELALNRALADEQNLRKNSLAYLEKSTYEQAVLNAFGDNALDQQKEELQYSKDLAKASELAAMGIAASRLGLDEAAKFYAAEAKRAEDVANANLRTAQIQRQATLDQALRAAGTEKEVKAIQQQGEWLERNITNRETATKNTLDQLNLESQRIEFLRSEGMISEQAARNQLYALDRRKLELQTSLEILGVEKDILKIETKRDADIRALAGGQVDEAERIRKNAAAEIQSAQERAQAIKNITAARLKDMDMQARISDREKAYAKAFQNTFDGLADSLVQFAMTGEKTFKDLFRNLVADLARFELRLQTSALWMAVRGPLMQALGFSAAANAAGLPAGTVVDTLGGIANAKGNVYGIGLQKFAKGGTFTNQIVDSPTLFKFARGTGLMGEAGPEAIMPLKRDSQGNLGVRASAQSAPRVEVIVNNNSQTPATAKETVDSRGNRRIEVTVGDMVSGEMVRPGSSVRETMQANYGLRPALVRR